MNNTTHDGLDGTQASSPERQPRWGPTVEDFDRLINLDVGGRGVEHLYQAARACVGKPLVFAAAEKLAAIPRGSTVLITTGFPARAWVSASIAENDGPAGAAVLARALALGLDVIPVVLAERALLPPIAGIFTAAGLCPVSLEEARRAELPGGRLATVVFQEYSLDDEQGQAQAGCVLDEVRPALVFSTERAGRNEMQVYHNARGIDIGIAQARIDYLFEEAGRRDIPSVAVGDGGNEIGMGLIAETVKHYVRYGGQCTCGCGGGIAAITPADILVTAACSNWGCYAIADCLAILLQNPELLHTSAQEELLLRRGVELGLINASDGRVDPNADGIPLASHIAVVELLRELAVRQMER